MAVRSNISSSGRRNRLPANFAACTVASIALGAAAGAASAQNLPPSYGMRALSTSDGGQFTIDLQAGGYINAAQLLGPACVGMVAEAPDFRLQLQGAGSVQLNTSVVSAADTTLIMSTPDGQWLCNDDADGFNPAIGIPAARAGFYDIWVGTFSVSGLPQASLTIAAEPIGGAMVSATPDSTSAVMARPQDDAGWWYALGGERVGPVSIAEIQSAITDGTVTRETLFWRDGMAEWAAASTVDAVDALFPVEPPPLPASVTEEESGPAMPPPLPPALPDPEVSEEVETEAGAMPGDEISNDAEGGNGEDQEAGDEVSEAGDEESDEPIEAETPPAKPEPAN